MKHWHFVGAMAAGFASLVGASHLPARTAAQQQAGWMTDLPAARTAAQSSNKPLFIAFR